MTKFTTTTFLSRSVFVITAFTVLTSVSDSKNWPRSPASSYGNWTRLRKSLLHRNVRAVTEGDIRLVGGHTACQGNVEIYHFGQWGSICDDEWDKREADIVCRLLGYPGADRPTTDSLYGRSRSLIWMDNLYCSGYERRLQDCPFDGWKVHDCKDTEAAGVVCHEGDIPTGVSFSRSFHHKIVLQQLPVKLDPRNVLLRLAGGRSPSEGRVEIKVPRNGWGTVCGDGWEILEASVVCKQLGLGFAQAALQNSYFGGQQTRMVLSGVKCIGNENNLASCRHDYVGVVDCPQRDRSIAGVICTKAMPDLIPDNKEIEQSAYLEEKQLMHLQCAMEENCLSSSAYRLRREHREGYLNETRRLLRFTARIGNIGTADFLPFLPKLAWDWHACHKHYHSMEVFAHFDVIDMKGNKVAEGHKASFCLEDNFCRASSQKKYACANYGDQGISVGCTDNYAHNIDCQWVDVTDIKPGNYYFKVSINPEFKVPEMAFDNNAVTCNLYYDIVSAKVWNCTFGTP